jgi:ssDNA-binding Zn-finger/Zn-ribbon topoisomerase 1
MKSKNLNPYLRRKKKKKKPVKILSWHQKQAIIAKARNKRNFDFVIDWPRVEVSDKTIKRIAEFMKLSEEEAFDRAMDILECHDQFRTNTRWIYREHLKKKFRGNWIHAAWHSFENVQIGIENNRWTRIYYSEEYVYLPEELKQEIYLAEDGRCEECGQAMHYRVAHFKKRNWTIFGEKDNIMLVCYCCAHGRSNMLLSPNLIILDDNMEFLRKGLNMKSIEEVKDFIRSNLKYAVHTNTYNPNKKDRGRPLKLKMRGQYWLPGIGRCRLQYRYGENGKEFTLQFTECAKEPKLHIQPQKCSRNLRSH